MPRHVAYPWYVVPFSANRDNIGLRILRINLKNRTFVIHNWG